LYKRAEEDFREALRLDPTDAECYMELSELLKQLGKQAEAAEKMNKALSILNRAIQADTTDERSYLERAEVYDRLGQMRLAITDLEQALTLVTMEYQIESIRNRLEALRKRGEVQ
jgi:Flp pilus assembly protein TadD